MAKPSDQRYVLRQKIVQLRRDGRLIDALKLLDTLISQKLAKAQDWCDTGDVLAQLGEFAQSLGAYEKCLELDPDHIPAAHELGRSLYRLGDADRAATLVEQVAMKVPTVDVWSGFAAIAPCVPQFGNEKILSLRTRYAEVLRQAERPLLNIAAPRLAKKDRISIGYVSAHFGGQNYMKPVWPVINSHDTNLFDIHLFDDNPQPNTNWDWLTSRQVRRSRIGSLTCREAAEVIQSQHVDILVDLSSHSAPKRLGIFAHRPSPIAASWFNQFATGGMDEIEYIIGDKTVLPIDERCFYTEQFAELPLSYLTFQVSHATPDVAERPFDTTRPFVFGSLGTMYKINSLVIDAWSRILQEAPQSQLVLSNHELKSKWNCEWFIGQFESRGIDGSRLLIRPPAAHYEFLRYYDDIDLALDTFPYNGGTTTMEAIWQGVPVVTFNGDRWASRTSRSLLHHSPLAQFVAPDLEEYIRMAARYANDHEKRKFLSELRSGLRSSLRASSVCDSVALARSLEQAYAEMICKKLATQSQPIVEGQ